MDGSSCSTVLLHQVFHVSPITLDLVIHVIPPPLNQAKFVQGGLRLQSWSLHSFSSHTVESFVLYFCICNLPFYWLATNTMRIAPNSQSLMGSSWQNPNQNWSFLSDSCQKLQHLQRLPDPSSPLVLLVQPLGDHQWFGAALFPLSSCYLLPRGIQGYPDSLLFSPLPVNSVPCTPPQPNPQNKDPMQNFYRNALMSTIFDQLLVCVL